MVSQSLELELPGVHLPGDLQLPADAKGLIIFSHGSGSSRMSERNRRIAAYLNGQGQGTLLFDLLTEEEDHYQENRFDIPRISRRLVSATEWVKAQPLLEKLPIGYFGASTGAASALYAAAHFGDEVKAIVCRGGRPDLALQVLPQVVSPTLLIVGGHDEPVLRMNRRAMQLLRCPRELKIINGATHLFEESGKLDEVAREAGLWYEKYMH